MENGWSDLQSQDGPLLRSFKNAAWGFQWEQGEDPVSNLYNEQNRCIFFAKGLDVQEMFGQIAGLTPTFDQLIIILTNYSSLVEQMLTKDWNVNVFFAVRDS